MTHSTCIWPDCRKIIGMSSSRHLCALHVAQVIAEHRAVIQRMEAEERAADARMEEYERPWRERRERREAKRWDKVLADHRKKSEADHAAWTAHLEAKERHPGYIYYLRIGGHYKIGWAKRLEQRLKAYPPDGSVLAVHEGSRQDEGKLHRRFSHLTTAGREWYPLVPDITRHIDVMVEQHGSPDPALRCGPKPVGQRAPQHYRNGPTPRGWMGGRQAS